MSKGKKARKEAKRKQNSEQSSKSVGAIKAWYRVDKRWLWLLGILILTILCFSGVIDAEFVNWDDDKNFYENQLITSITGENFWSNTVEIFTTPVIGNYNPLSIWTFALDKMLYGLDNPTGWHLTNLGLHLLCVVLAYRLALLLGLGTFGSMVTALLFAIHPMRVESVAWVTERKDVLYGVFYLGALVLYIRHRSQRLFKQLIWILVLFTLSLFSKIQAVALPLSMLCIDYLFDGKISLRAIISKWYYFALSLAFGLLGIYFLQDQGSLDTNETLPLAQRLFIGTYSLVVYFIKAVVPYRLSPLYPYPAVIPWYIYASAIVIPLLSTLIYIGYRKDWRVLVFGLLFFLVNIVFLLQILGAGQGFLADRFTYIAYFGLFYLIGWSVEYGISRYKQKPLVIKGIAVLFLLGLGSITYTQNSVWKNSDTLWSHVLKYYKQTTLPYGNRANYLRDQGQTRRALADYNMAIKLKDANPQAYNSRGKLYFTLAKTTDTLQLALRDYQKAISYDPDNGEYYVNLGATYARLGQVDQAIKQMDKGISLKPNHAVGYLNRSVLHNQKGDLAKALLDIDKYLKLRPYNADMWYEKGRAMRQLNQVEASVGAFARAIEINNSKAIYYYEKARTLAALGRSSDARNDLKMAISLGMTNIDTNLRSQLGI